MDALIYVGLFFGAIYLLVVARRAYYRRQGADWKGVVLRRFRLRTLRFEWGRKCYRNISPVEDVPDVTWWEWNKT